MPLPCKCTLAYCSSCWDRSLAASVSACGSALCPSCRSSMQVEFNPSSGQLTFSRSPAGDAGSEARRGQDWRRRLYEQAKPLQIRLLQEHGAAASAAGAAPLPAVSSAAAEPPAPGAASPSATAVVASDAAPWPPNCVCGSRLAHTSVRDRVMTFIREEAPVPPTRSEMQQLLKRPPIMCDICGRQVSASESLWTCENGRRTVLHAVAYDVCHACFCYHAFGIEPEDPDPEQSGENDSELSGEYYENFSEEGSDLAGAESDWDW